MELNVNKDKDFASYVSTVKGNCVLSSTLHQRYPHGYTTQKDIHIQVCDALRVSSHSCCS